MIGLLFHSDLPQPSEESTFRRGLRGPSFFFSWSVLTFAIKWFASPQTLSPSKLRSLFTAAPPLSSRRRQSFFSSPKIQTSVTAFFCTSPHRCRLPFPRLRSTQGVDFPQPFCLPSFRYPSTEKKCYQEEDFFLLAPPSIVVEIFLSVDLFPRFLRGVTTRFLPIVEGPPPSSTAPFPTNPLYLLKQPPRLKGVFPFSIRLTMESFVRSSPRQFPQSLF